MRNSEHAAELNNPVPFSPFFFLKPPSSLLLPHEGPIVRPRGIDMHHEVELGLVISRPLKDLHPNDTEGAMRAIAAYVLAIDLTARNLQNEAKEKRLPWTNAKGFDTFCPISEPIAKERLGDPDKTELKLTVDGTDVRQHDSVGLMLFKIPRILSEISSVMRLDPGDIVLTGTPKGVGPLKGGQRVSIGIEKSGSALKEANAEWDIVDAGSEALYEFKG